MISVSLFCVLVALTAEPDPAAMVAQLGSGRYTEREVAGTALKQLVLLPGAATPPAWDHGALRLEIVRIREDRDLNLALDPDDDSRRSFFGPRVGPETNRLARRDFAATLLVTPEPRLVVVGYGDFEDLEAVDDQGGPLRPSPSPEDLEFGIINVPFEFTDLPIP